MYLVHTHNISFYSSDTCRDVVSIVIANDGLSIRWPILNKPGPSCHKHLPCIPKWVWAGIDWASIAFEREGEGGWKCKSKVRWTYNFIPLQSVENGGWLISHCFTRQLQENLTPIFIFSCKVIFPRHFSLLSSGYILAYFAKMKVGLSDHLSVCLSLTNKFWNTC
jgi:hypothetical protein